MKKQLRKINIQKDVANQIKDLRVKNKLSKSEMSRQLATSIAQVTRLEDPKECKAGIDTLVKIANLFEVDLTIKFTKRRGKASTKKIAS